MLLPTINCRTACARAQSLDADKSGTVTLEELQAGLAKQGTTTTQKEVQSLIESLDLDANGSIDYDEFLAATVQMSQLQARAAAWRCQEHRPLAPS